MKTNTVIKAKMNYQINNSTLDIETVNTELDYQIKGVGLSRFYRPDNEDKIYILFVALRNILDYAIEDVNISSKTYQYDRPHILDDNYTASDAWAEVEDQVLHPRFQQTNVSNLMHVESTIQMDLTQQTLPHGQLQTGSRTMMVLSKDMPQMFNNRVDAIFTGVVIVNEILRLQTKVKSVNNTQSKSLTQQVKEIGTQVDSYRKYKLH